MKRTTLIIIHIDVCIFKTSSILTKTGAQGAAHRLGTTNILTSISSNNDNLSNLFDSPSMESIDAGVLKSIHLLLIHLVKITLIFLPLTLVILIFSIQFVLKCYYLVITLLQKTEQFSVKTSNLNHLDTHRFR